MTGRLSVLRPAERARGGHRVDAGLRLVCELLADKTAVLGFKRGELGKVPERVDRRLEHHLRAPVGVQLLGDPPQERDAVIVTLESAGNDGDRLAVSEPAPDRRARSPRSPSSSANCATRRRPARAIWGLRSTREADGELAARDRCLPW
jgi:hypothetical protein